jgi:hypothetical protein
MTDGEQNTKDRMSNGSRKDPFQLQQEIHDSLRVQHPDWVEPNRDCPTCESYESRLAELFGLSPQEPTSGRIGREPRPL